MLHRAGVVGRDRGDRRRPSWSGATYELGRTERSTENIDLFSGRPQRTTSSGLLMVGACIAVCQFAYAGVLLRVSGKEIVPG